MPSKKDVKRICACCGKEFLAYRTLVKRGKALFCGRNCSSRELRTRFLTIGATGAANPNWKGGITVSTKGYTYVCMPDHPRAMQSGYVKRADVIAEKMLGRTLRAGEIVHHKNGNKQDDNPENLEVLASTAEHTRLYGWRRPHANATRSRQPDHPCNRRYAWLPDAELLAMRRRMTLRQLAKVFNCSFKAIDHRITKCCSRCGIAKIRQVSS